MGIFQFYATWEQVVTIFRSILKSILIIGGGAAGFFTAINLSSSFKVTILEASKKTLQKVAISGGGRCNVTHSCFLPRDLVENYPRGKKELKGPYSRFQPENMIQWLSENGVELKTEHDGRIFPVTDSSNTIINCFKKLAAKKGVKLETETKVKQIEKLATGEFLVKAQKLKKIESKKYDFVALTTGSSKSGYKLAASLGHTIVDTVPSLFTFELSDSKLKELAGVSTQNSKLLLKLNNNKKFTASGPTLITHWGVSGPAVIKLSAFAARELFESSYQGALFINWAENSNKKEFSEELSYSKIEHKGKLVTNYPLVEIPKRLWSYLCNKAGISADTKFSELSNKLALKLETEIFNSELKITGKGVFKEEFVTAGGIKLSEIDFNKMESKKVPGLYLAGEILDIDGITGGFNFQSAWTAGYIISESLNSLN